jgi:hypothetical protein
MSRSFSPQTHYGWAFALKIYIGESRTGSKILLHGSDVLVLLTGKE